jgi:Na+/citrate or Na+/malate symporter
MQSMFSFFFTAAFHCCLAKKMQMDKKNNKQTKNIKINETHLNLFKFGLLVLIVAYCVLNKSEYLETTTCVFLQLF